MSPSSRSWCATRAPSRGRSSGARSTRGSRRGSPPPAPARRRGGAGGPGLRGLAVAASALIALVVSIAVLASADLGGGTDTGGGGGAAAGSAAPGTGATAESAAGQAAAPVSPPRRGTPGSARGGSAPPSSGRPRAVDRRTTLELAAPADEFAAVSDGVIRVSDGVGGVVQRADVTERGGEGFATFDLRIPAGRLDEALAQLSRLGEVRSRTATSEDITGATVSAQDRLDDARAERRAVLRALGEAEGDRLRELRGRLRVLRARIAAAEGDVRGLRRRADVARVQVSVQSTGAAGAWTPGDALRDAGRVLEVVLGVALVALAVLAPLALLAALALGVGRLTRRRRREAILG
jgi:hypothetical protein